MILSINTSVPEYCVSICDMDGSIVCEYYSGGVKENFKDLVPAVEFLLKATSKRVEELKAVFVAIGPGKFTGLRVGLSFAKGLAYALHIPIVGINSLDALAANIPLWPLRVATFIESRRDEWFVGLYERKEGGLERCGEVLVIRREAIRDISLQGVWVLGHNYHGLVPVIQQECGGNVNFFPPCYWGLRSSGIIFLGLERLKKGESDDPKELVPLYMREPEFRMVFGGMS